MRRYLLPMELDQLDLYLSLRPLKLLQKESKRVSFVKCRGEHRDLTSAPFSFQRSPLTRRFDVQVHVVARSSVGRRVGVDPALLRIGHEVEVEGEAGRFSTTVRATLVECVVLGEPPRSKRVRVWNFDEPVACIE